MRDLVIIGVAALAAYLVVRKTEPASSGGGSGSLGGSLSLCSGGATSAEGAIACGAGAVISKVFAKASANDDARVRDTRINYGLNGHCAKLGQLWNGFGGRPVITTPGDPNRPPSSGAITCVQFGNGCRPACNGMPGCARGTINMKAHGFAYDGWKGCGGPWS